MKRVFEFRKFYSSFYKREHFFDLLKFIAMVLVCVSHINFLSSGFYYAFNNAVFLLELPVFFFVTGMLQYKSKPCITFIDYSFTILKRFICYMVPYITFHFFRCIFYNDYFNFLNRIFDNICYPFNGLWFLLGMFLISLVLETTKYITFKKNIRAKYWYPLVLPLKMGILWFLFLKLFKILPFTAYFRLCLYYSVYILFGYYLLVLFDLSKNKKRLIKKVWIVSMCVSLLCFFFIIFYFKNIYGFDDNNIYYICIRILGSVSGIIVLSSICFYLIKYKISRYISFGGMFTIQIYYIHVLFLPFIPMVDNLNIVSQLGATILWNVAFILGSLLIVFTFYFVPYLNFIIFGSHFSGYKFEKQLLTKKSNILIV